MRCTLLAFLSIFLLSSLLGCKESFEVNHSEDLSIESANDGSGTVFSSKFKSIANGSLASNGLNLEVGDTFTYYVVKRLADGTFKESSLGEWFSSNSSVGTAAWTASGGKSCVFTALAVGTTELKVVNGLFASKITVTVSAKQTGSAKWDFATPSDYTFVSQYIDISGGKASLKTVDSQHEGFTGGTHVGTYLDSGKLTVLDKPTTSTVHVNSILPAKSGNLVGYWRMDGSFEDSSENGNNGTATDATLDSVSKLGSHSVKFDGAGDDVSANSGYLTGSSKFTISFWAKANVGKVAGSAYSEGIKENWPMSLFIIYYADNSGTATPSVRVYYDGTRMDSDTLVNLADDKWHHVVYLQSATNDRKIYIDGLLADTDNTNLPSMSANSLSLGANDNNGVMGQFMNGNLDEVATWNTDLTEAEIHTLYAAQNANFTELSSSWTPHYDDIVGYWKMDGNWQDSSGNGNHLTANGGANFDADSKVGSQSGKFLNIGDNAQIPNNASLNPDYASISVWAKVSNFVGCGPFLFQSGNGTLKGFRLFLCNADSIGLDAYGTAGGFGRSFYIHSTNFDTNRWYHLSGTYDGTNVKLYLDGKLVQTQAYAGGTLAPSSSNTSLGDSTGATFDGALDDLAFWGTALSSDDISLIYHRQKQKYAGHYESPVIDLGQSGNWTNLNPKTTLPFYKEIAAASESSSDYTDLSGDLSNGLQGYWKFNGDNVDSSSSGNNATLTSTTFDNDAILGSGSLGFDGTNSVGSIPASYSAMEIFTVSAWAKAIDVTGTKRVYTAYRTGTISTKYSIWIDGGNWGFHFRDAGSNAKTFNTTITPTPDWTHLLLSYDGVDFKFFVNGELQITTTDTIEPSDGDTPHIGAYSVNQELFNGSIDELSIWSRALTDPEIQQLYRRGANRIKYQVKSCVDSNCNCKSFGAGGSTNDCDGDSTPNSSETVATDIHLAEWIGKNGSGTEFSELVNCTTPDGSGDCSTVQAAKPDFTFVSYPAASQPANNRYFQYKVLMEAEENTLCTSSAPCMPELESIEVGPTGRYYGGSPVVASNSSISYSEIQSLTSSEGGSCSVKYQLSPDNGTTYYYWNGSAWTAATGENVSEAALASDVSTNISSFDALAASGNLHFKAFLESNTSQSCELSEISTEVKE